MVHSCCVRFLVDRTNAKKAHSLLLQKIVIYFFFPFSDKLLKWKHFKLKSEAYSWATLWLKAGGILQYIRSSWAKMKQKNTEKKKVRRTTNLACAGLLCITRVVFPPLALHIPLPFCGTVITFSSFAPWILLNPLGRLHHRITNSTWGWPSNIYIWVYVGLFCVWLLKVERRDIYAKEQRWGERTGTDICLTCGDGRADGRKSGWVDVGWAYLQSAVIGCDQQTARQHLLFRSNNNIVTHWRPWGVCVCVLCICCCAYVCHDTTVPYFLPHDANCYPTNAAMQNNYPWNRWI